MSFLDMFVSNGGNNDTGWAHKKYDQLIAKAKESGNPKIRSKALHDAEKILMDEMPIAPVYFYTRPLLRKNWVKGARRSALGFWDFKESFITKH
jgi:oligopeptide transport system substrate-binding protein